jgi:hypothetical protein
MKKVLLAVSMVFWAGCASAATMVEFGPYTTDLFAERPYLTEKAWVVEQGRFEVQGGYSAFLSQSDTVSQSVRMHVNYGITKDMTLGICFPYGGDYTGVNDAQLGFKYSLNSLVNAVFPNRNLLDLSLTYSFVMGSMDYTVKVIAGKDWGRFRLYSNLGYVKRENVKTSIIYGAAVNCLVGMMWDLGGEVIGEIVREPGVPSTINMTVGAKYWFIDDFNVDLGIGTGFSVDPKLYATAGFTWLVGN